MPWHMIQPKGARSQRGETEEPRTVTASNRQPTAGRRRTVSSRINYSQREAVSRISAYKRAGRPRHAHTQKNPAEQTTRPETAKEEVPEAGRSGSAFYIFFLCGQKGEGEAKQGKGDKYPQKARKRQKRTKGGKGAHRRVSTVRLIPAPHGGGRSLLHYLIGRA